MKDWASHYDDIVAVTGGKIDTLFPPDGKVKYIDLHNQFTKLIQSYTGFICTNCSSTCDSFRFSWHNIGDVISTGIWEEMKVECAPSFDCRRDPFNWVLYEYLAHVCSITLPDGLLGLIQILKNSEYFWAFRDLAILTERPVRLSLDEEGLIHSDDQMAIEYSDGWGMLH